MENLPALFYYVVVIIIIINHPINESNKYLNSPVKKTRARARTSRTHFTNEETCSERGSNLPKVTQPELVPRASEFPSSVPPGLPRGHLMVCSKGGFAFVCLLAWGVGLGEVRLRVVWLVTVTPGRTPRAPALTRAMAPPHKDRPYFGTRHRG